MKDQISPQERIMGKQNCWKLLLNRFKKHPKLKKDAAKFKGIIHHD